MIESFDYFFGGHVEMTEMGFRGKRVDDRNESDGHLATVFDEALSMATLMEPLHYDTLWLAEHHYQREGYGGIGNVPLLSVWLAGKIQRLKFGAMFNTVPAWHPLRLAEDYATADILTEGRVRFGIGRGYINREIETLGSPLEDNEANRDLFEEQVDIIFKAWNQQTFVHHGKYYDLPPKIVYREKELEELTLVPRPSKLPVECWQPIVSVSSRGIDFMMKHGIKGVVPGGARVDEIARKWQTAHAERGCDTELGEGLALVLQVMLGDTEEEAISEAEVWFEEQIKVLSPLGMMPFLSREQILATYDPGKASSAGLPTVRDLVRDGAWICGPPEHVYERICDYAEKLPGLKRVSVGAGGLAIPPSVLRRNIEWFGKEVLPRFDGISVAAG